MRRLRASVGIILAWVIVLWGCFVVAFGSADFYTVAFGGAAPGELVMGEPAPTIGQAVMEIAIGVAMITLAMVGRHKIRMKLKAPA